MTYPDTTFKLIKIDVSSKAEIENLQQHKIALIAILDKAVLAQCDQKAIAVLNNHRFNYLILSEILSDCDYYLVWALDNEAAQKIHNLAKVLFVQDDFFIIQVRSPADFSHLLQYRIELSKINFTPVVCNWTHKSFSSVVFDPTIQMIVDRVCADSVLGFVSRLVHFRTRYSTTDSCRAAAHYLSEKFIGYGLDSVICQEFNPNYAPNVVGIKRGLLYPESIYIVICGHFDCISGSPDTFAPGADDNGSGTAGILEAARVMQANDFAYSIRFIGFSGEEQGLLGSHYYAYQARNSGDSILGVINIDMVAYALAERDSASIIGKPENPNCAPLVDYFIACADTYTQLKTQRRVIDRPRSDHASFNQYGYLAIHCRENLNLNNPYYHTTGDTIGGGFNHLNFCTEVIKASIATVASLAQPINISIAEEKSNEPNIQIIPNPATKWLRIKLGNISEKIKIKIYDVSGKIKTTFEVAGKTKTLEINSRTLNSGVYFLHLIDQKAKLKSKVVVP